MTKEIIFNPNCKHEWIKRQSINPFTKKIIASWETCVKCGSERMREVYKTPSEVFAKLMLRRSFKESTPRTREEKLKRALRRRIKK